MATSLILDPQWDCLYSCITRIFPRIAFPVWQPQDRQLGLEFHGPRLSRSI